MYIILFLGGGRFFCDSAYVLFAVDRRGEADAEYATKDNGNGDKGGRGGEINNQ
jgi:hypothetical protein